ncbi:MAG: hypothetical protein A2741_01030 [Candidatus Zambryskibacteria bacterium RIFCSPHIGHO2_01_FULL_43_27]|uniref:Uncharacterized protein n=1 Tax=Candidatus Zambryskibacteria bacterium RIFCSPLOWO2_01_FULL_43_17 TaxID=1802760 RepID=A0A1G2U540_9BACT|nr:MAG: hypothetical protein A2741_01030 [Candidatus Zambryskibacteria bacterium RIFCSPHIGHO2_01_FULL_43_27]OHB00084.1 MAG: hypothetical protein A3E93_02025 [Candidatus Zambryskibacteria bacterium RIFCSPHIGHO2_12_FULL_43_12b]OHB04615.1 MAG: hypothetical protein A2920_01610 [Candidatus Zambryskibacteria bacterium RIFCSPLOWO2_01_FULL_43_17]
MANAMRKFNKQICRKLISTLLLLCFVITPTIAEALPVPDISSFIGDPTPPVPVSDSAIRQKEVGGFRIFGISIPGISLDSLMITIAREAVDVISDDIINWINDTGGDQKGPLFITDPLSFFTDIADNVGGEFIKSAGLEALCSPFRVEVKAALTASLQRSATRDIDDRHECTLTDVSNNIDAFVNGNFAEGGWPAWFELTQHSKNNPYGAFLEASTDLGFRITSAQGTAKLESEWGKGFLNLRDCETPATGIDGEIAEGCAKWGPTKTPGTVIEQQLNKTFDAELDQLNIADEFDEIFGALMGKLMGQILNSNEGVFTNNAVPWAKGGLGRNPNDVQNPSGTCRPSPTVAIKGDVVTWTLSTNASPNATFTWGGDDSPGDDALGVAADLTWPTHRSKRASTTYNLPTPPSKKAWVDIADTVMIGGVPTPKNSRVDCSPDLIVAKYPPITGTCIAADWQTGAQIYTIDNLKYMAWIITNIQGGSGNYVSYTWDGTDPKVNTGNGSGAVTVGIGKLAAWTPYWTSNPGTPLGEFFTFFPWTLPDPAHAPGLPDPKKFVRWYVHGGTKTADVTVIDADRVNNPNAVGVIDCPTDRTVPFRVIEVIPIP